MRQRSKLISLGITRASLRFALLFCGMFGVGLVIIPRLRFFERLEGIIQFVPVVIYVCGLLIFAFLYDLYSRVWLVVCRDKIHIYPQGLWGRAISLSLAIDFELHVATERATVEFVRPNEERIVCGPLAGRKEIISIRLQKRCAEVARLIDRRLLFDGALVNVNS